MQRGTLLHSGHVLFLARQAHVRATETPSDAEVSIALSAAALEGFINETAHQARSLLPEFEALSVFVDFIEEAEEARLQTLTKFRLGFFALNGTILRKGDHLAQQVATLMRLRNSLMHLKPDPVFELDEGDPEDKHPDIIGQYFCQMIAQGNSPDRHSSGR